MSSYRPIINDDEKHSGPTSGGFALSQQVGLKSGRSSEVAEHEHRVKLIFIINGENFSVEASDDATLRHAVERALRESGNTGRPPDEWEVRDSNGVLLEMGRTIEHLGLKNGARLFLSLRVGAGGGIVRL